MNPLEFGYYLRGLCSTPALATADLSNLALQAAAGIVGQKAASAPPPAMRMIRVPEFCVHNVHDSEYCAACGPSGERIYGFKLAAGTKAVYIQAESKEK